MINSSNQVNKKKSVCAVIVSYNSPIDLKACINSIFPQVDHIVVIDNNSDEYTKDTISNFDHLNKVQIIYNKNNNGVGYAFNQGILYALENSYEWTLLLDQDSVLSANTVTEILRSYDNLDCARKNEIAMLVPRVYDKNKGVELPAIVSTRIFNKKVKNPTRDTNIHFQISSGSLINNKKIQKIGLMNEKLFIDYIDYDYCFRILASGHKILQCKDAFLYLSLGELKQKCFVKYREHSPLRVYYQTRNRLYIIYKYGSKYRSIRNSEIVRMLLKLPRIIVLETNKQKKIKFYIKGLIDFARTYESFH